MPTQEFYNSLRFEPKNLNEKEDNYIYDELSRRKSAEIITTYLLNQDKSKVITINSAWGTGKTWFTYMWKNMLSFESEYNQNIIPIYYNAWENDEYEDTFIPLLAEIKKSLPDDNDKLKAYIDAAGELLFSMSDSFLNKLSFRIIKPKDILKIYKEYKNFAKSKFDDFTSDFEKKNTLKNDFKDALTAFTNIENSDEKMRIFIFVDELDRCRPTFAIETLERIKHFFEIENVFFILMQDSEQLSKSVKVLYGNECDTVGYLRRFIDVEFSFPEVNNFEIFDLNNTFTKKYPNNQICLDELKELSNVFNLSLRDYEKLFTWLDFIFSTVNHNNFLSASKHKIIRFYQSYFLLFKLKFPEKYNKVFDMPRAETEIIDHNWFDNRAEVDNITDINVKYPLIQSFYDFLIKKPSRIDYIDKTYNLNIKSEFEKIPKYLSFTEIVK